MRSGIAQRWPFARIFLEATPMLQPDYVCPGLNPFVWCQAPCGGAATWKVCPHLLPDNGGDAIFARSLTAMQRAPFTCHIQLLDEQATGCLASAVPSIAPQSNSRAQDCLICHLQRQCMHLQIDIACAAVVQGSARTLVPCDLA